MPGRLSNAVIAGGGIGGLATALALAQHGIHTTVCERRAEFPEEGAGIQIGPNGTRILQKLGIAQLLQPRVSTPDALSVRDGASARELARLPLGAWMTARYGAPYWTAHRKDLHAALRARAESTPMVTLRTNIETSMYENVGDEVCAIACGGEELKASLLVAADGVWSKLRNEIAGNIQPETVGKTAYRAVVGREALPQNLDPNAIHIWLAPRNHAVHYPVSAGREIALIVIADDAAASSDWDRPALASVVAAKIKTFAEPLQNLVSAVHDWRQWSLHDLAPVERWFEGRAVLLGDAAHPVLPFLAQGAVMALEDAVTLADVCANPSNGIEASLRMYQKARRARVTRVAAASRRNGRIYHMSGAAALARNGVMRLTPPERVMSKFDWLYGWA